MTCRSDDPVLLSLHEDLARLARVQALPETERMKWAAGIEKLERRIEEERAACGIDITYFSDRYYSAMAGIQRGMYNDNDLQALCEISIEASAAYISADPQRLDVAFSKLDKYADTLREAVTA